MSATSIVFIGPVVLDRIVSPGLPEPIAYPGGNALIQASIAARFGTTAYIVGRIGDDDKYAPHILALLAKYNVNTSQLLRIKGHVTKVVTLSLENDGVWTPISSAPELFPYVTNDDISFLTSISAEDITKAPHVHIAGLNSLLAAAPTQTQRLLEICRERGLSYSIGLSRFRSEISAPTIAALLSDTDTIFCSRDEFCVLHDCPDADVQSIRNVLQCTRYQNMIVTLGPDGVLIKSDTTQTIHQNTGTVRVKCTVGAGDVFVAVFLSSKLLNCGVAQSAARAMMAASLSTTHLTWDRWVNDVHSLSDLDLGIAPRSRVSDP